MYLDVRAGASVVRDPGGDEEGQASRQLGHGAGTLIGAAGSPEARREMLIALIFYIFMQALS